MTLLIVTGLLGSVGVTSSYAADPPTPSPKTSSPPATTAPEPSRATFGIQPASATTRDPRPFLSFIATKGASADDHVSVVNYSVAPLVLAVYATDALNNADGGFGLLPAATKPTDAGSWVQLKIPGGGPTVTVPGRSSTGAPGEVIVPFHLSIPANATPGDHVGGVIAALSTVSTDPNNPNVRLDQRIATRLYIRVAGALQPQLKVEKLKVSYVGKSPLGGDAKISYRVHNVGNVKLGGRTKVAVQGLLGTQSTTNLPDFPLLLPGSSLDFSVTVKNVIPEISEKAKVTIVPLVVPGDNDPDLHNYSASRHFFAIPWILLAVVLLLLVIGSLVWRWWRLRKSDDTAGSEVTS